MEGLPLHPACEWVLGVMLVAVAYVWKPARPLPPTQIEGAADKGAHGEEEATKRVHFKDEAAEEEASNGAASGPMKKRKKTRSNS